MSVTELDRVINRVIEKRSAHWCRLLCHTIGGAEYLAHEAVCNFLRWGAL